MIAAFRGLAGGWLELRSMLSAEPVTVGSRGYPLLLQSGEAYHGQPLHDRQHPHDLFMEVAAMYDHPLSNSLGVSLYLAPVGEPALGPVAFPHRASAMNDPLAPLGHHWQDATHVSFGVTTAGVYTATVKFEGSVFNGREPDDAFGRRIRRASAMLGLLAGAAAAVACLLRLYVEHTVIGDGVPLATLLQSFWGRMWQAQIAMAAFACAAFTLAWLSERESQHQRDWRHWWSVAILAAIGMAITPALTSHAMAATQPRDGCDALEEPVCTA